MSLYDSASLVMIPSGVKEDKLYSIKPTDGSGDFTFSRGSDIQATRVNSSGLIEKAKVNLLDYSNDFSNWTLASITPTSGQSGYDGSSDAWLIDKTNTGGAIINPTTLTGVATHSVYAKAGTLDFLLFYINYNSGTDTQAYFDLQNGSVGTTIAAIDANIEQVGATDWYRCDVSFNCPSTLADVRIFPAVADNDSGGTGTIYLQDAQLNYGLIAQDYVETTTTSVVEGLTADLPRLDYHNPDSPTPNSCPSLLLEPSRTNLFEQSDYLSSSFWFDDDITRVQNTTDTLSPEGAYNAVKLTETATSARHRLASNTITITNANYSASVFLKKGTARYGFVHLSGAKAYTIVVDLEDGTITDTATNDTIVHQSVEDYGNGWYRCSVAGNMAAVTTAYIVQFGTAGSATPSYSNYVPTYLGSTSNNIYAFGAQLEAGSYPTSYIPTYSAAANRGGDFNGNTDTISDDSLLAFNSGDDFTLFYEGSFKDVSSTSNMLMGGGKQSFGANYQSYFWVVNGGEIRLSGTSEAVMGKTFSFSIVDDTRYKILAKRSGSTISFFVNGVKGTTTSQTNPDAEFVLRSIGWSYSNGNYNVAGDMNQALVFQSALTDAECIALTTI